MRKLFDYSNFWLIWLGCAGNPDGTSLFKIQESWQIKTNYLYHKETGLGKPLVTNMLEAGYLGKGNKGMVSKLDWIPAYMVEKHAIPQGEIWSINGFIVEKMPLMQKFMEKNREVLFDPKLLALLYKSDLAAIKKHGAGIFDDIYLFVFLSNLAPFCISNNAEIVVRMLNTMVSFSPEKDLLGYFNSLRARIPVEEIPRVVESEAHLVRMLAPNGAPMPKNH